MSVKIRWICCLHILATNCLEVAPEVIGCYDLNITHGKLIDVFKGETVHLFCNFCGVAENVYEEHWYYRKRGDLVMEPIFNNIGESNIRFKNVITIGKKLVIHIFQTSNSGIYICRRREKNKNTTFNYVVDGIDLIIFNGIFKRDVIPIVGKFSQFVITELGNIRNINEKINSSQDEPFASLRNKEVSFILKIAWESWGQCLPFQRNEGVRKKLGKCLLQPIFNGKSMFSTMRSNNELIKYYLRDDFAISCHSIKLKASFPDFSRLVRSVPDYEATETCIVAIDDNLINETHGYNLDESVTEVCIQVAENSHCTLVCSESSFGSNLKWYKDKQLLNSSFRNNMADRKGEPHISIDTYNVLYILHASKEEAGKYTCTIDDIKTGQYSVKVVSMAKILNQDLIRYSIYLGFVLSLTVTCYCAGLCVAWHKRASFKDPYNLHYNKYKKKFQDSDDEESKTLLLRK